jgi:aspartate-semialdehyde dehydrogenase
MKKLSVGLIGVSGLLGRHFLQELAHHPWFELTALIGSEQTAGKKLCEVLGSDYDLPPHLLEMKILSSEEEIPATLLFSAAKGEVAGPLETKLSNRGYRIITCARPHRLEPTVPLLIPEVNQEHLSLLENQKGGWIVAKPNCSVVGIALALKPIHDLFGLEKIEVTTLQALSGAGLPGVASLDILDNVLPNIAGEEERIVLEPRKIFGSFQDNKIIERNISIGATTTRVPVSDGHMAIVSFSCQSKPTLSTIIDAWHNFSPLNALDLPSAPKKPIHYSSDALSPQPRLHRMRENGMAVTTGRLRSSPHFDATFILLCHNALRGGAKGAILGAELLYKNQKCL